MNTYIIAAQRTAVGSFMGQLSSVPAPKLGAEVIKSLLNETGIKPDNVDECIMGQVLTAGVGQAPARQASIYAGLPTSVKCMTINKVCGSGLKAVMLADDNIKLGRSNLIVAGGQENMSQAPHLLMNSRNGYRMGNIQATDSMVNDGLWDPYNDFHMGNAAEVCAKEYKFSREEQDNFAIESYKRSQKSQSEGLFKDEIIKVEVQQRKSSFTVDADEEPGKVNFEKVTSLRPAFDKEGSVTAANASSINDGASAMIVASKDAVQKYKLKPMAKVVAQGHFAQDPVWFTTAPVGAIKEALKNADLKVEDIDLWEINEAFANVTMAAMKELNIPHDKVNVHGGSVSIGHPIGASGARITTTLLHALKTHKKKYGLATLCIGGGEAVAVIFENLNL